MKLAVLSDIHGNFTALESVLVDARLQGIDKFIVLGDAAIKGPMPKEVLMALKGLDVIGWVKGNTDAWFEEISEDWEPSTENEAELYKYYKFACSYLGTVDIEFLKNLPQAISLTINEFRILCIHGSPASIIGKLDGSLTDEEISQAIKDVSEDVILCGHTHNPYIGGYSGKRILNAGGLGISYDGDNRASYGILEFSRDGLSISNRRVEYPLDALFKAAEDRCFPMLDKYRKMVMKAERA